jgi:cytochrome P450
MATASVKLDHLSREFLDNPYPIFAKFRAENPVAWDSEFYIGYSGAIGAWHIFRYADIKSLLQDRRTSSETPPPNLESYPVEAQEMIAGLFSITKKAMLFSDPPKHTRLRSLVGKAFNPQVVEQMRPRIQEIVDRILDNLEGQTKIEFIRDFAEILPINVVADLIGFPLEDHPQVKKWAATDVAFIGGAVGVSLELAYQSRTEYLNYIQGQIDQRRQHLGQDLLSALIFAQEEGDRLSDGELQGMLWVIILAGFETTAHLLGNCVLALLEHPEQLQLLRENPALVEATIEEILRYNSSAQVIHRVAKEDLEFQGNLIKAGQDIFLWPGSANRDPDVFPNPDCFDITRQPNPHIGFGSGIHLCLGAPLARLETQIALRTILQRLPDFHLAPEGYEWGSNVGVRGLKSLPLVLS